MTVDSMRQFMGRFEEILAELDALCGGCDGETAEDFEDMNAELEDALMLLAEQEKGGDGWREDVIGTLEDIQALAGDYNVLANEVPGLEALADRLDENAAAALEALEA